MKLVRNLSGLSNAASTIDGDHTGIVVLKNAPQYKSFKKATRAPYGLKIDFIPFQLHPLIPHSVM